MPEDLFPALDLGDCLDEAQAVIIDVVLAGPVSKGDVVARSAAVSGDLDSVVQADAASELVVGVALKAGVTGDVIPVLKQGIVKVTAPAAITGGTKIVSAATGGVAALAADTFTGLQLVAQVIGRALQTFGAGDTGLVFISI